MKVLIVHNKLEVVGKGIVLSINLKDNNLSDEIKVFKTQLKIGDEIYTEYGIFEIKGIETSQTLEGFQGKNIGLIVKAL